MLVGYTPIVGRIVWSKALKITDRDPTKAIGVVTVLSNIVRLLVEEVDVPDDAVCNPKWVIVITLWEWTFPWGDEIT